MKRNYTNILQLIALLFVSILCCTQNVSAAYTLAVYPNANPTDIQHFDFVQKPSNVPDEMRVVANFSGNANDYSFWVGQDYAKDAYSADVPLSNVILNCTTGSFTTSIYTTNTAANHFPHDFICLDTDEYIYGMACWYDIAANCGGGASSAGNHVFTTNDHVVWTYSFPLVNILSGFKILKSADGVNWAWNMGQLGHEQSRTFLTEGTGVNINITASGWAGDCTLDLPSIANGDTVLLSLTKSGANYAISASYELAKPEISTDDSDCSNVVFEITNYQASRTYTCTLDGSPVTLTNGVYSINNPQPNTTYIFEAVVSEGALTSEVSTASFLYEGNPDPPVVQSYRECQQVGTATWSSLVNCPSCNLLWYDSQISINPISEPSSFDKNTVGVTTYYVSQVVDGCESSRQEVSVTVYELPNPLVGLPQSICSGSVAQLGSSPVADVDYSWSPADKLDDATIANPTTLPLTSSQEFTLTVQKHSYPVPSCSSQASVWVTVVPKPSITLDPSSATICEGSTVRLRNLNDESADVSYLWEPSGLVLAPTSVDTESLALNASQDFALVATNRNIANCISTDTVRVNIVPNPTADAGNDRSICEGSTTQLGTPAELGMSYFWTPIDKVDNANIAQPNTVALNTNTIFLLNVVMTSSPFCSSSDQVTIDIDENPDVYTVSGDSAYCEAQPYTDMIVELSGSSLGAEYMLCKDGLEVGTWTAGTGMPMSWPNNPKGVYTVKARTINTQCELWMNGSATIIEMPAPTVTMISNPVNVCPGETIKMELSFTGTPPYSFDLSINNVTSTLTSANNYYDFDYEPAGETVFMVRRLQDKYCEVNYANPPTYELQVDSVDSYKILSDPEDALLCPGDGVNLYVTYSGTTSTFLWSTGATGTSINVVPAVTTKYSLRAVTFNGCIMKDSIVVTVGAKEHIQIHGVSPTQTYCSSDAPSYFSATPQGGAFSIQPATTALTNGGYFDPSQITSSGTWAVTYTYADLYGCIQDTTFNIYVNVLQDVDWYIDPDVSPYQPSYTYCIPEGNQKEFNLVGVPGQANGTWKLFSNGGTSTLSPLTGPTSRLTNVSAGVYNVEYSILDNKGCKSSMVKTITVREEVQKKIINDDIFVIPNDTLCYYSNLATIRASNIGGTFTLSTPAMKISEDITAGELLIDPSRAGGQGEQQVIYTMLDDQGCPSKYSKSFYIKSPTNIYPFGIKSSYCNYENNVLITVSSATPTTGTLSIYKNHNYITPVLQKAIPQEGDVYFQPSWGEGVYELLYEYNDGICDFEYRDSTHVYAPDIINMNLKADHCLGDVLTLAATPSGGIYGTDAPQSALVNNVFYTSRAGLNYHDIWYTVNNEHACQSSDTATILVHGTNNMGIYYLQEEYCEPKGVVQISGIPKSPGVGVFTGPTFLTNLPDGYANIDLSQSSHTSSYTIAYHYTQTYQSSTGVNEQCTSSISKRFKVLNESSDFFGIEDNDMICGSLDSVVILGNHAPSGRFEFSQTGSIGFRDYNNGTAVIYPTKLGENVYSITYYYDYRDTNGDLICTTEATKSFSVTQVEEIQEASLFCDNNYTAVRLHNTDTQTLYELNVNNAVFQTQQGVGGDLDFNPLTVNAYIKIFAYKNGCKIQSPQLISTNVLRINSLNSTNIQCYGDGNGSAIARVSGGGYPYMHQIRKNDGTFVVQDSVSHTLTKGQYTYSVSDSIGCSRTATFRINEPDSLIVGLTVTDLTCFTERNGQVAAAVSGGMSPYSFTWYRLPSTMPISNSATITNLSPGDYRLNLIDNKGCQPAVDAVTTVTVTSPPQLLLTLVSKQDVLVTGEATGAITINVSGGQAPYFYNWTGRSITPATEGLQNQTNLLAGRYYVKVWDALGCATETLEVEITEPQEIAVSVYQKNVSCYGLSDGKIMLNVTGGTPPFTYTWTSDKGLSASTRDLNNIPAAVYTVHMVDSRGKDYNNVFIITEPNLLESEVLITTADTVDCFGDKTAHIDVRVTGGTTPYTLVWSGPDAVQTIDPYSLTNIGAGTYQLKIVDYQKCRDSLSHVVTQPSLQTLTMDIVQNICNNSNQASITLTAQGGVLPREFYWSGLDVQPHSQNQINLWGGEPYTVRMEDRNHCTITVDTTLYNPSLIVPIAGKRDVSCNAKSDGKVWVEVTGGVPPYVFVWQETISGNVVANDSVAENLPPLSYTYIIKDALQCEYTGVVEITEPAALTDVISHTPVLCYGDATGTAKIEIANGTGTAPYSYVWTRESDGAIVSHASVANALYAGDYKVDVTDAQGCVLTDRIEVTSPNALKLEYTKTDVTIYGQATGTITLNVTEGVPSYSFEWDGHSINPLNKYLQNQVALLSGNYYVNVSDANSCSIDTMISILQPEKILVTADITPVKCKNASDGSILLSVSKGTAPYSYAWTSDKGYASTSRDLVDIPAAMYHLEVIDANGDTFISDYQVSEPDSIKLVFHSSIESVACFGDKTASLNLDITGGSVPYKVTWNGPDVPLVVADSAHLSDLGAGIYYVYVSDANECKADSFRTIIEPSALQVSSVITENQCYGVPSGSIQLSVVGGSPAYTYTWSGPFVNPNQKDQFNIPGGLYQVRVQDANQCEISEHYDLIKPTELDVSVSQTDVSCFGLSDGRLHASIVGGSKPYVVKWENQSGTLVVNDTIAEGLPVGTYTLTIVDSLSCVLNRTYTITQPTALDAQMDITSVICTGATDGRASVSVTSGSGTAPYSYKWTKNPNTDLGSGYSKSNLGEGSYTVVVTDHNGCMVSISNGITESIPIQIGVVDIENVQIIGAATGHIILNTTGGFGNLTYTWHGDGIQPGAEHDRDQYQLKAGWYYLTVEDDLSCSETMQFEITEPSVLVVKADVHQITCFGLNNAYIEMSVTGGTNTTYSWKYNGVDISTDKNIYDLSPGDYLLTLTDVSGIFTYNYLIIEPSELTLNQLASSKLALNCAGDKDGVINIEVNGGTPQYTLSWTGPDIPHVVTNPYGVSDLGKGLYRVDITDANKCYVSRSFQITEPDTLLLSANIGLNTCNGDANGTITLAVNGGTPAYIYKWTGIGVDEYAQNQSSLIGGRYNLRITDQNLCEIDTAFVINNPASLQANITGISDICEGDEVTLYMVSSGVAPWTFVYTDGLNDYTLVSDRPDTSVVVKPLIDTEYSLVSVEDGMGCEAKLSGKVSVTVHKYPSLQVLSVSEDCCLGDEILVDLVISNEGPWTLKYSDDGGSNVIYDITKMRDTLRIAPLRAGNIQYTIDSISTAYCTTKIDYSFDVIVYPYPNLIVTMPAFVCQSDTLHIALEPQGVGPWQLVYYENGIRYFEDIDTSPYDLVRTPDKIDNNYLFESITTGQYCTKNLNKDYTVSLESLPGDAMAIIGNNAACRGTLERYYLPEIINADKYEWILPKGFTVMSGTNTNDITVSIGLDAEKGTIRVHGVNSCGNGGDATLAVDLDEPFGPVGDISAPLYICENEALFQLSIDDVEGATLYEWAVPEGYSIISGEHSSSILVSIDSYAKSGTVSITPTNRCASADKKEKYLSIRTLPLAEAGVDLATNCINSVRLGATDVAGTVAKWTSLRGEVVFSDPAAYNSEVSGLSYGRNPFRWDVNDGYCLNFDTMTVYNNNPGITDPEFLNITICDDSVTLRAPKPLYGDYRWTLISGDGVLQDPTSNVSLITDLSNKVTNIIRWEVYTESCSNTIDVEVVSHSLTHLVDAGDDGATINGSYRLSARSVADTNVTGRWSIVAGSGVFDDETAPNTYVTGLAPGINTVRWTLSAYDCEAYDELQVRAVDEPIADFSADPIVGCKPLAVIFTNTTLGDAEYLWDFGDGTTSTKRSPDHVYTQSGTYTVTLTATGTRKSDQVSKDITVYVSPVAEFSVSLTQLYTPNAEAHFYCKSDKVISYLWDFGDGGQSTEKDPTYIYREDGLFDVSLVVENSFGCKDTLKLDEYVRVGKGSFITFPTAFVPNLTEANGGVYSPEERRLDIFYPVSRNVDTYKLEIFNQWGVKVFVSEDLYQGWDGYYLGKCAQQATYSYKAEGYFKDGTSFRQSGNFMLVR